MRRRISIRGCVRPSVRRSVTPSLRRLLGASYAEYSALFFFIFLPISLLSHNFTLLTRTDFFASLIPVLHSSFSCPPVLAFSMYVPLQPAPQQPFWAADPKGTMSCRIKGKSVRTSIYLSVRSSVPPSQPASHRRALDGVSERTNKRCGEWERSWQCRLQSVQTSEQDERTNSVCLKSRCPAFPSRWGLPCLMLPILCRLGIPITF